MRKVTILGVDNRGSEEIPFGYIYFSEDGTDANSTRLPFASHHAFTHREAQPYWRRATRAEFIAAHDYLLEHGYLKGK